MVRSRNTEQTLPPPLEMHTQPVDAYTSVQGMMKAMFEAQVTFWQQQQAEMSQEIMREVARCVVEMAGGVTRSPDISSARNVVGGSRTGTGTVPIPQMKVEIPKYRDRESIHQFFLAYKRSMMTLKILSKQWGTYLSSSLSGETLEVFSHEIADE